MRYGIFSDVHANLEALEAALADYQKEKIDEYLCIGDVVGYAANPRECIEKVKRAAEVTVAGNHDWASIDLFPADYFNPLAKEAVSWTQGNLQAGNRKFLESLQLVFKNTDLTLVHGTLESPEDFSYLMDSYAASRTFALLQTPVCFVGHSHVPGVFIRDKNNRISYQQEATVILEEDKKYIFNVGSVGQPRDDNPDAAYCVYDADNRRVQIKRIKYDIQTARKKIIEAGLPKFLGDRLLLGR